MDISVIVCTYNPDEKIFRRCLDAISNLDTKGLETEFIIIDNNSTVPISSLGYVDEFVRKVPDSRIIVENAQGLTFARIRGFQHSTGDILVFFDDDNEPFTDYLVTAKRVLNERPFVGVMGPGCINIKYMDKVDPWISSHLNNYFQEKNAEREEYVLSIMKWFQCYPPGTGQIVRRFVFDSYRQMFINNELTTSDRKGDNLASAGDSQIIWSSINLNYAVGHHPEIRINHLIPSRRANMTYIKRLSYYLSLSGTLAFAEMYPGSKMLVRHYSSTLFLFELVKECISCIKHKQLKNFKINIASIVGSNEAHFMISRRKIPFLLRKIKQLYKFS